MISRATRSKNSPFETGRAAVGLAVARGEEDQVDVAGVVQLQAAELSQPQDDEPGGPAVGAARRAPLPLELSPRRPQGRLQNRVGQEGNLRRDGSQALPADNVAIGDPQGFPSLEPPQRPQARPASCVQGGNFRAKLVDHRLAGRRFALGQPHEVEPLRVSHQQIAEVLAGREDLQQRGHGVRVALEERAGRERIPRRPHEPFQVVQGHVGVGTARQVFSELIADDRQQVQRHAGRGHAQQVSVRPSRVDNSQLYQPRDGGGGIIEALAEGCDFHKVSLRQNGGQVSLAIYSTFAELPRVRRLRPHQVGGAPRSTL